MGGCSFEYNIPFLTRLFKKKVKVGGLHGSIKSGSMKNEKILSRGLGNRLSFIAQQEVRT